MSYLRSIGLENVIGNLVLGNITSLTELTSLFGKMEHF